MPSYKGLFHLKFTDDPTTSVKEARAVEACVRDAVDSGLIVEWLSAFIAGVLDGDKASTAAEGACIEWDI